MKIGFLGLGLMGGRMATRLSSYVQIKVWNRSPKAYDTFPDLVPFRSASIAECVQGADVVFTMLSNEEAVESVAFSEDGLVRFLKDHGVWVDCSTVGPSFSERVSSRLNELPKTYVAAPVAGSIGPAKEGQLVFLMGGSKNEYHKVEELLTIMGKKTLWMGSSKNACIYKLIVNGLLGQSFTLFAEAIILGKRLGLSEELLFQILPSLPVIPPFINSKVDYIKQDEYPEEFPMEWMAKDLHLLSEIAFDNGLALPTLESNLALYQSGKTRWPRSDFSAIYRHLSTNK